LYCFRRFFLKTITFLASPMLDYGRPDLIAADLHDVAIGLQKRLDLNRRADFSADRG